MCRVGKGTGGEAGLWCRCESLPGDGFSTWAPVGMWDPRVGSAPPSLHSHTAPQNLLL